MKGTELALSIIKKYQTSDVFTIAEQAGIKLHFEKWQPVTYGEFHKKDLSIHINLNAPIATAQVLAHELGHFFIHQLGIDLGEMEEEAIVGDFAKVFYPPQYCTTD
jgi:Zn-dependent peptidase ImmA (M78 family)